MLETLKGTFPWVLLTLQNKRGEKKRKIENEWKTKDGKKRLLATTLNLFRQICSDKWTDEAEEEIEKSDNLSSSNIRNSKTDLENFIKKNTLKPSFIYQPLLILSNRTFLKMMKPKIMWLSKK